MGISTHILDTSRGRPAPGLVVVLERRDDRGAWSEIARGLSDVDGRIKSLLPPDVTLSAGVFRLQFAVESYLERTHGGGFYPEVSITFTVKDPREHFHVPLLLSPFGFSSYRGS